VTNAGTPEGAADPSQPARPPEPKQLSASDLELLDIKVTRDGGSVRYLEGAKHGLATSIYRSEVVPGSGPGPHTHPYTEYFVLNEGQGQFHVGTTVFDAEAGDIVIVPPGVVHAFVNTGAGMLRQTAIHEAPVHAMTRAADLPDRANTP
jgi:quercetin dioxygenase-like cupin family protein